MLLYADRVQITQLFNLEGWKKKAKTRFMKKTAELFPCGWESPCGHTFQARLFLWGWNQDVTMTYEDRALPTIQRRTTPSPHSLTEGKDTACKIRELNICFDAELFCFAWNCNRSLSSALLKLWQSVREESLFSSHSHGRNCCVHHILSVTN